MSLILRVIFLILSVALTVPAEAQKRDCSALLAAFPPPQFNVTERPDHIEVSALQGDHYYFAEAKLTDGILRMSIYMKSEIDGRRMPGLRGSQVFAQFMDYFGSDVRAILGDWMEGDNLDTINRFTSLPTGLKVAAAARRTWTAKQAARFGFTKIKVLRAEGRPGAYHDVQVLFSK